MPLWFPLIDTISQDPTPRCLWNPLDDGLAVVHQHASVPSLEAESPPTDFNPLDPGLIIIASYEDNLSPPNPPHRFEHPTRSFVSLCWLQAHCAAQTHKYTNTQTYKHTDIQTHRHTNTQTHRHTNIQTRKLANTHARMHTHTYTYTPWGHLVRPYWNEKLLVMVMLPKDAKKKKKLLAIIFFVLVQL